MTGKRIWGAVRITQGGRTVYTISDYNHDEVISIDENTPSCVVRNVSQTIKFFGPCVPTEKGRCKHVESVVDLLRFGATFNETWIGEEWVRGIRLVWKSSFEV